ncbi:TonB-dependent receptor [Aquirufa sp. WAEICH-18A]|uniref:TonB-dependent receptor n=2 Tax=Aquirufa aurantiipilula TaxID=2696561 RepID=A0ABT6BME0_9BACT|nr:TonB-dependent receptor [Aquirufa aurantiipilula]MDF5691540.1 TonB-dependent receptor [Aquirufa aurantiipilula]
MPAQAALAERVGGLKETKLIKVADISVTGKVTDETNAGIPGVNVMVKGTTKGVMTDANGSYKIVVADSRSVLVFSAIGYIQQEIAVGNQSTININLKPDNKYLDEIVVIGYGTQKKSDLTGSVSSIKTDQLLERPATSLNQALSGRMAGVQVSTNSGRPGGRTTVRVRGFSSINSSNNPLYVVDGVMLPQGNMNQFSSAIDYLNPNDIVSVEVLKDASSTAIYGARGANGVILVTTKKGKSGEGSVTYNADFSVNVAGPNKPQVLNAKQYMAVEDLAWANMAKYDPAGWAAGRWAYLNPKLRRTDPRVFDASGNPLFDTDWFEESTQNKLSQNHQLGFSGGNDRTQYSFSLGYRDDQGLIKTTYLKRYSGRFTIDDQIKKWLKVGGTLAYNNQTENLSDVNDAVSRQIVEDFPFLPVKYADGTYANNRDFPFAEGTMSSVHRLMGRKYILNTQTTTGSVYSNITLMKGLEMKTILGANIMTQENNQSQTRTLNIGGQGNASATNQTETFWSLENFLTYTKDFNENHSINALLGISWQQTDFFNIGASVNGFATDYFGFNNLGAGAVNPTVGSGASKFAFNSYFGRVNYTFKNKYLATVTARADGSSKFGENYKFAIFPSGALAWRVSEEDFLKGNATISNLKVRTSYGLTGNSEIPAYSSLSLLSSNYSAVYNDGRVSGTGISRLANPDLKWEKTAQTDFGIELGLWGGRVNIEADYYYRLTTDMLLDAPVPQTSGYATIRRNVGSMENKGFEFSINSTNIKSKDFQWNTQFNISFNRNKVLTLATPSDIFNVGGPNFTNPTNIIRVGEPVGSFWGLTRLGIWGTAEAEEAAKWTSYRNGLKILPGDIKYKDFNGDRAITDADRSIIGNGSPDFWGAISNSFKYKSFDLTLEMQFNYGNEVMLMNLHPSEDRQALANSYTSVLNAWTPTNQNTMIAEIRDTRAGYVTNVDTWWIKDGSFLRGRNLMLGYNLPSNVASKLNLSRLRVYATAQNFFLLVKDPIVGDPEVTPTNQGGGNSAFSQGMIWHNYPKPTIYMLGLQVAF